MQVAQPLSCLNGIAPVHLPALKYMRYDRPQERSRNRNECYQCCFHVHIMRRQRNRHARCVPDRTANTGQQRHLAVEIQLGQQ
jgi:hypothetical protein